MEKFATENLILLEFLVDQINLDFEIQQELASVMGETCVSFQFLDNAPLLVCEQDFSNNKMNGCGNIKSGKSCLFSLTPQQAEEAAKTFDITVEVFKKMKPGVLPDKIPIGASLISIVNLFNELVDSIATAGESPAAKALKDCFKISNSNGENVGHISVYIRMSCFGKLIVTQFQMNLEDKSVQFKAKEGHYLFKYNKAKGDAGKDPDIDKQKGKYNVDCPRVPCSNFVMDQMQVQTPQQVTSPPCPIQPCPFNPQLPLTPNSPPCGMPQMYGPPCSLPMETPCIECSAPPPTRSPSGAYQEIGAQMGGNALTIRVHKDKAKIEEYAETVSSDDGCCCTVENFGKKKKPRRTSDDYCTPCPPNQQQQLAMRPGVPDSNAPFSFKMGGCGQAANNNVIVNPPTCTANDGTVFTEISDPNKDVFILRIGKKSEGVDKKNNLELELCTPKGPDIKPPPKKETRDTQYDPQDVPAEECGGKLKGKGKGKGKGGKKKKK
ncbi:hypothetical protein Trydic_g12956 [Trypoxylus dichotomus]